MVLSAMILQLKVIARVLMVVAIARVLSRWGRDKFEVMDFAAIDEGRRTILMRFRTGLERVECIELSLDAEKMNEGVLIEQTLVEWR